MLIYRPPTKADDPPATIPFIFPQKNTAWTASSWVFRGTVWQIGYNDCLLHYKCTRKLSVKNDGKIGSSEHLGLYKVPQHIHEGAGEEHLKLLLIDERGTRWGWVVSLTPRPRFTPEERNPCTHFTGSWVDSRASLDTEAKEKILLPLPGIELDRPVVQSVVKPYTDWATPAPKSIHTST
jgi:hypothetical protein